MRRELLAVRSQLQEDQFATDVLQQRYHAVLSEARDLPSLEDDLLAAELKQKQEVIDRILERIQALKLELSAPERVVLRSPADEPTEPLNPVRPVWMLAASAGCLIAAVLFAALWRRSKRR
jgi:uncharacterized protein involved in exopolysaccharide biosynthesis